MFPLFPDGFSNLLYVYIYNLHVNCKFLEGHTSGSLAHYVGGCSTICMIDLCVGKGRFSVQLEEDHIFKRGIPIATTFICTCV